MSVMDKKTMRARRHARIRKRISGTAERPRFCVSITDSNIYCQFIDDVNGKTLASVSTLSAAFKAENAKPKLTKTVHRPIHIVEPVADTSAYQGWKMVKCGEMSSYYGISL